MTVREVRSQPVEVAQFSPVTAGTLSIASTHTAAELPGQFVHVDAVLNEAA